MEKEKEREDRQIKREDVFFLCKIVSLFFRCEWVRDRLHCELGPYLGRNCRETANWWETTARAPSAETKWRHWRQGLPRSGWRGRQERRPKMRPFVWPRREEHWERWGPTPLGLPLEPGEGLIRGGVLRDVEGLEMERHFGCLTLGPCCTDIATRDWKSKKTHEILNFMK